MWKKPEITCKLKEHQLYSKVDGNHFLTDKAYLYQTMHEYYKGFPNKTADEILPVTYHLTTEKDMTTSIRFNHILQKHQDEEKPKIWILKPGENSNRGLGI